MFRSPEALLGPRSDVLPAWTGRSDTSQARVEQLLVDEPSLIRIYGLWRGRARADRAAHHRRRSESVSIVEPERSRGRSVGVAGGVSPPLKKRDEPSVRRLTVQCAKAGDPRPGELQRPILFVICVELGERPLDRLSADAPGGQPRRHRAPSRPPDGQLVLGGLAGEVLVVDQADRLEARELSLDLVALEPRAEQPDLELTASPGAHGEEPQSAVVTPERLLRSSGPGHRLSRFASRRSPAPSWASVPTRRPSLRSRPLRRRRGPVRPPADRHRHRTR